MAIVTMPALSPTMTEGKLSRWLVKQGDEVRSGDVIAEIETDKAVMEVEALEDGSMSAIHVAEGTEGVKVGTTIAEISNGDSDASTPRASRASISSGTNPNSSPATSSTSGPPTSSTSGPCCSG